MSQYQKKNSFSVFGPNLRALRGSASQADFAKFLGIANQVTYHRYENGRVPNADVLQQLAGRLGITLDDLLSPLSQDLISEFHKTRNPSRSNQTTDWKADVGSPIGRAIGELVNDESVKQLQSAFGFRKATDEELLQFHEHVIRIESRAPFQIIKFYGLIVAAVQRELARRMKIKY